MPSKRHPSTPQQRPRATSGVTGSETAPKAFSSFRRRSRGDADARERVLRTARQPPLALSLSLARDRWLRFASETARICSRSPCTVTKTRGRASVGRRSTLSPSASVSRYGSPDRVVGASETLAFELIIELHGTAVVFTPAARDAGGKTVASTSPARDGPFAKRVSLDEATQNAAV